MAEARVDRNRRRAIGLIAAAALAPQAALAAPRMTVHKDPNCGCCSGWVEHLRQAGFVVDTVDTARMNAVKTRLGVPLELASCHTGEIAGYVIEGHVPAPAVERLLRERPAAVGLAVPGMPIGSPGMEGGEPEVYEVILFEPAGQRSFGHFRGAVAV